MQRRWNVFPFSITTLITICRPCLEKSSKDSNKIYQLFAKIPYNSYFQKHLKVWYQWFEGRHLLWGFISANLDAVSQRLFQKNLTTVIFCSLANFFTIDITQEIAQKILNTKVKQVLQRRGGGTGVAMELQRKLKWTIKKTLL